MYSQASEEDLSKSLYLIAKTSGALKNPVPCSSHSSPACLNRVLDAIRSPANIMKLLLCTFVVVLLCTASVHSLQCYTCVDGNCKTPTDCPSSSNFCKTVSTPNELSRTCEEFCVPGVNVHCCQGDLCG
ncbi:lymphocyte antigen 6D [Trichomycterus rosablanca]|uniref:lymphocyte antigen 6D n=1 Tax=Trichomycterus rosablanca TaxID=2290929 RepID=UPI002F350DAF